MLEKLSAALHLAFRQEWAIRRAIDAMHALKGGASLKQVFAVFLMWIEAFNFVVFEVPMKAHGQELDLTGYTLVYEDEFDGDTLDLDAWYYRGSKSRGGYKARSQVELRDSNVVLTGEYREDGLYGPGWYGAEIALRQKYCRGYFEIRCICSDGGGFWSAFWIQADHPYDHELSAGGPGGAELDIFEADLYEAKTPLKRNAVTQTIHLNGWDDDVEHIDSRRLGHFRGNDIYHTYNTYGLEWTEDEYIFYINGVETTRSSFGNGVSEVPEEVIVSLCLPEEVTLKKGDSVSFYVDYVRIYQK